MPTEINIQLKCCNINGTYAELLALHNTSTAVCGQAYTMTDHSEIYFQPISGAYKVATLEPIVLMGNSSGKFDFVVRSTLHPTDVIHYDITVDTVTDGVTTEPAKGRIIYRKDENGNEGGYDWRNILNFDGTNEFLTFNDLHAINDISGYIIEGNITNQELPNVIFKGVTGRNKSNYFLNSVFNGNVLINNANQITNSVIEDFFQNNNCRVEEFTGSMTECNNVNVKDVSTDIGSCNNLRLFPLDLTGVPFIANCSGTNIANGLDNCTIISDGVNGFNNNVFETVVTNKTIDINSGTPATSYPELFNSLIKCYIYTKNTSEIWYRYYDNSNVLQFKQII
jgi:hypothetical protein